MGASDPPINVALANLGIDTFSSGTQFINSGVTGPFTLLPPPQPSAGSGEFSFIFFGPIVAVGSVGIASPWTCFFGCASSVNSGNAAFLANYTTKNAPVLNYVNSTMTVIAESFVSFAKNPTVSHTAAAGSNSVILQVTAAGDTIVVGFNCLTTNGATSQTCGITAVTDTFGSVYKKIPGEPVGVSVSGNIGFDSFAAKSLGSGADTITVTLAGTGPGMSTYDLTNVTPANPNTPSVTLSATNKVFQANEDDNGGLFAGPGAFDLTQTVTLGAAGTTTFPLWAQPQHGIFEMCTVALRVTAASGTGPTLNTYLQDSADNVGFNDRASFPQATAAANYIGAVSGGVGGITPVVTADGTLAAGSKIDGPLSAFGRIKFVVAGTGPSFTITYNVACR